MKKFVLALILAGVSSATFAQAANASVTPVVGSMMYSTGGKKLAPIYKLNSDGSPQIMLEGRLVTLPVATLSEVGGKVETTLTKRDLLTSR